MLVPFNFQGQGLVTYLYPQGLVDICFRLSAKWCFKTSLWLCSSGIQALASSHCPKCKLLQKDVNNCCTENSFSLQKGCSGDAWVSFFWLFFFADAILLFNATNSTSVNYPIVWFNGIKTFFLHVNFFSARPPFWTITWFGSKSKVNRLIPSCMWRVKPTAPKNSFGAKGDTDPGTPIKPDKAKV